MAGKPLILALANPEPEILPMSRRARDPTRSLRRAVGFPEPGEQRPVLSVHFRGALDVGATAINEP